MNVYQFNIKKNIKDNSFFENGSILLLGKFEVFHIGHKILYDQAKKYQTNEKIGILLIVKDEKNQLQTVENRLENLFYIGFDFVILANFDFEFKKIEGNEFIKYLDLNFNVKHYIVGSDFKFGYNKKFSALDIKNISPNKVDIIDIFKIQNQKVSSSSIKQMHEFGEYNLINQLLVNPLTFDIEIKNQKIIWIQECVKPHFGNYFFQILIDDYWYSGLIRFSINRQIEFKLINFEDTKSIFDQKSKIKIIDIERIIVNQKYDLISEKDIEKTKHFFSI